MTLLTLPSPREEAWRWSDLSALPKLAAVAPTGAVPEALPWIEGGPEGPRLVFVDGTFDPDRSDPRGVSVSPARYRPGHQPLADLAGATARAGYAVALGPDEAVAGLVQIVHISTGGAAHVSNRIALAAGAEVSVIETHVGGGWSNASALFELGPGARLRRVLRVLKAGGAHTDFVMARLDECAGYDAAAVVTGAESARIEHEVDLAGAGARAEVGGALLARGAEKLEGVTVLRHLAVGGASRQVWRSVADDRASASVAARVEVARGAQKTDAEQNLKGLLLDRGATINAKPELEIFADDVKCAHGASVGELDREALFYLESRGVTPAQARGLLTRAFVADALDRIGEEAVRAACYADAGKWFGGANE